MRSVSYEKRLNPWEHDEIAQELYYILWVNGNDRTRLLWDILIESDMDDRETLREKIFEYGSELREKDYMGRTVFVRMAKWLELV